jgi:hypothetical protein
MYGDEKNYTFLVRNPKKRHHLEDINIDGRMLLKQTINKMGWCWLSSLGRAKDKWWVLVNNVINLRTAPKGGICCLISGTLRSSGKGNPPKTSVTTVGVTAGIRTGHLQNTNPKCNAMCQLA